MKNFLVIGLALSVSACGSSEKGDEAAAVAAVNASTSVSSESSELAATESATLPVTSEAPKVADSASSEKWKCSNNGESEFTITFSGMVEKTNPRGGSEIYGKYRTTGEAYMLDSNGSVTVRGGVYFLNETAFEPTPNGKFFVHETDGGDIMSCQQ